MRTANTGDHTGEEIHSVGEILDMLRSLADRQDKVSIGDVLDTIGDRSYGPAMMLPAMIEISPIGGIPGVPTLLATIVALVAAQLLIGKEHLWLPQLVQKRAISAYLTRGCFTIQRSILSGSKANSTILTAMKSQSRKAHRPRKSQPLTQA